MLTAFDLDSLSPAPVWTLGTERELGGPPYSDPAIGVNNGILGTPVIDAARGAVYLVSRDCEPALLGEAPPCRQRLFAIDLGSGKIKDTTVIEGSVSIDAVPVPFERSGPAADEQGPTSPPANGIVDGATQPADFPAAPGDQEDSVVRLPVSGPFPAAGDPVAHHWDSRAYRPDGNVFQFMEKTARSARRAHS